MNRQFGSRAREDNDGQTRRRLKENEEKIIRVPAFDNSDLIAKFKQTLSGRIVGKALGVFDKADVEGSRVRVFVNGNLPLKFYCKIGFANGDVVKVTIQYKDLYRHCFFCKRLSHEEGTCPELNEDQRARNRLARIEQKEKEERATKEAFSIPQRQTSGAYIDSYRHESRGGETRSTYQRFPKLRRESRREEENDHDLRKQLKERRENVWNRLDSGQYSKLPRNRDRYHPYQHSSGAISKERTRDTASSSEWRPKRPQGDKYDKQPARPWNQTNTSSRSRRSPDSQRTISDNPQRQSSHAHARGRNSRSPPSGTLEWRPVNRHRETRAPRGLLKKGDNPVNLTQLSENDDAEKTASRRSNTEVYEPVRDKQTNISLDDTGKERENEVDTNMSVDKEPPIDTRDNGLKHGLTHGFDQETEKEKETEREKEDRELENEIDEYAKLADLADLDMTDDMVNQDDLLDEMELLKEHTRDDEMEDGRIEAISQLSPERQCTKTQMAIGKKTANHEVEKGEIVEERETVEQVKQDPKNKASAQQTSTLGKKRGARSPDLKGASASRKLASRGRFSPKSKNQSWNLEILNAVITAEDIPRITSLRVSRTGRHDSYSWDFTKSGVYSTLVVLYSHPNVESYWLLKSYH
ncbi:hypothetical protein HID58_076508 [Brassica napus]|uniref:Zinc knuckle CX2CX4HX4C domain-containing protein n=1 Tax=Brassica napus TaxID=3708 RepID=A0ABQ7YQT4_BRANA|nr:hypothetical protein HID58_076508 [Brassica napus]